jgi:hypothetical protein
LIKSGLKFKQVLGGYLICYTLWLWVFENFEIKITTGSKVSLKHQRTWQWFWVGSLKFWETWVKYPYTQPYSLIFIETKEKKTMWWRFMGWNPNDYKAMPSTAKNKKQQGSGWLMVSWRHSCFYLFFSFVCMQVMAIFYVQFQRQLLVVGWVHFWWWCWFCKDVLMDVGTRS